jgi:hypothetical protein
MRFAKRLEGLELFSSRHVGTTNVFCMWKRQDWMELITKWLG